MISVSNENSINYIQTSEEINYGISYIKRYSIEYLLKYLNGARKEVISNFFVNSEINTIFISIFNNLLDKFIVCHTY